MAFCKAKITRFNDIKTFVPPPGTYNPKYNEHVPGVKYMNDTKPEPQSPASSASDARSIHSGISLSGFRTPTIPRRKNSVGSKKPLLSPQKSEMLREKIVECQNKDETIKDLENQLEDLKLAIDKLNVEKNHLIIERDGLSLEVYEVKLKMENINKQLLQTNLDNKKILDDYNEIKAKNTAELKQLQENINLLLERLEEHGVQVEKTEKELQEKTLAYSNSENELKKLNKEYTVLKLKYDELHQTQIIVKNNHTSEIENLKNLHQTEAAEFESDMRKVVENWKELVNKLEKDCENKIKDLETQQKLELEKLLNDNIKEKTESQCHINDLKSEKEHLSNELQEIKTKLQQEMQDRENEKSVAMAAKHCYEITLNKTYDTVNALKNRLLNSDRDVEQLAKELETLEKSKLEIEREYIEKNKNLENESKFHQQALINLFEKVVDIRIKVFDKMDDFSTKVNSNITKYNANINKQSEELINLHAYIKEQEKIHKNTPTLITDANNLIEKLKTEVKLHISRLEAVENENRKIQEADELKEMRIKQLKDKLKEKDLEINELASIYKKYIEKSRLFDDLQQKHEELEKKCECLETMISEQNALIGPFREQLENYDRECQTLLLHKGEAEKEAKEMGLKYAEILGHQNYRQKVKHIVDLKKKNIELMESKRSCEAKIQQQNRTIEKLKQQISQQNKSRNSEKNIDKENLGSPKHFSTPIVLKERN